MLGRYAGRPPRLEHQLAFALLEFERLDAAWPRGCTAIERAEIGRRREQVLSEIVALRQRIATGRAETLRCNFGAWPSRRTPKARACAGCLASPTF